MQWASKIASATIPVVLVEVNHPMQCCQLLSCPLPIRHVFPVGGCWDLRLADQIRDPETGKSGPGADDIRKCHGVFIHSRVPSTTRNTHQTALRLKSEKEAPRASRFALLLL